MVDFLSKTIVLKKSDTTRIFGRMADPHAIVPFIEVITI